MFLLLCVVQFAVAAHAQHIAQSAASRALATARAEDSSAAAGAARAETTLRLLAGRVLTAPAVQVDRSGEHAVAHVEGTVMTVVPGLDLKVSGHAAGPVEKWTAE
ncbi:pilus assembly protein [Streptomyces triticagri]|uniref:Pilus assembly protein n=2 Tax=Streptomyces triticagri TaxID=2293568 RepID=A0A372M2P3_9ACTN|nr:pilus assembly protein [Streptomyces triticagri]